MRKRFRDLFVLAAACLIAPSLIAPSLFAQGAAPNTDLSGTWAPGGGMNGGSGGRGFSSQDAPLQPEALKTYQANRAGITSLNEKGLDELDPNTSCYPPGAPRSMVMPYPFEIVQRPGVVYILFAYNSGIRRIYTDGRKHPSDPDPAWMGHSIGRWQGNTFIVDTVGFRPETWLDPLGTPHSDALHMVERFRRIGPTKLEVEFQFDDPKTFTKPWGGSKVYEKSDTEMMEYYVCEENLQLGQPREVAH